MNPKKLGLSLETLRVLDAREAMDVNGARTAALACTDPGATYYCTASNAYTNCWSQRCIP